MAATGMTTDDIGGFWYLPRRVSFLYPVCVFLGVQSYLNQGTSLIRWWMWLFLIAALIVVSLTVRRETNLAAARQQHLAAEVGEPLGPGVYVAQPAQRPRVRAASAAPLAVLSLAFAAVLSGAGALLAPIAIGAAPVPGEPYPATSEIIIRSYPFMTLAVGLALAVALGIGFARGRRAHRRLHLSLARRPEQPNRLLTSTRRATDAWIVVGLFALGADAWLESTGRLFLSISIVVAVGCLLALPRAVVLARYRDDGPGRPELSWSDLRIAAGSGEPPVVDPPFAVVGPYAGPSIPGAVVEV